MLRAEVRGSTPTCLFHGARYLLELFLEVVVHPCVEERVVDGGAHGDHVRDEERQQEVVPLDDRSAVFLRHGMTVFAVLRIGKRHARISGTVRHVSIDMVLEKMLTLFQLMPDVLLMFLRHVQHVQRQPADDEYRHHGDEHAVRAALATNFDLHTHETQRYTHKPV